MYNFAYMRNNVKSQVFQLEPWKHQPGWTEVIWELVQLTTEKKINNFNEVWPWFLFMYTWHPKQNQVFLPVSGFPVTRRSPCCCPTSFEAISCAKWRSSVVNFSPWEPGWMLELVDWYACRVGEVDVLITRQPPDKGPNQSIPSMYIFIYMFGWFFMVNVGKYVIHGCSGIYIYICGVLGIVLTPKIIHHQKSTMCCEFLGYMYIYIYLNIYIYSNKTEIWRITVYIPPNEK